MIKTEKLNILFELWEKEFSEYRGLFVQDGIIDEETWDRTSPKVLFIAKEANHYGDAKAGDFRKDWTEGKSKYPFAYRIAEWAVGILEGFPKFFDIGKDKYHQHDTYLKKIAFINIKKLGGNSTSVHNNLLEHLKQSRQVEFLQKEIEIINPEIIVLCLSFSNQFKEIIFPGIEMDQCGYGIEVANYNNRKIIDFYHPSSRNGPSASYSLLQNVIRSDVFRNLAS